jgi:hypothetical protein
MPDTFTHREYADIIFFYGYCNGSANRAVAEYQRRYPNRRIPDRNVFQTVFNNAGETGMFPSARIVSERQAGLDVAMEEEILNMVEHSPGVSTRRIAIRLHINQTTAWETLRRNGLRPFHIQPVQSLQDGDYALRLQFCNWVNENRRLYRYILFTDEAQFTRDGVNNCHNEHRWSDENPHTTVERNFQHRFSINVWCGMINNQLLGPVVLDGRLTGELYLQFLENQLRDLLDDVPLEIRQNMYFQHDGAPAHYSRVVRDCLNNRFPHRWIGRGGPQNWPPRSPDLNPLDYCLWGWLKSLVYATKVNTREALLDRIVNSAALIRENQRALQRATSAIHKRADKCIVAEGGIFENI